MDQNACCCLDSKEEWKVGGEKGLNDIFMKGVEYT
jgi:hypothetical protein